MREIAVQRLGRGNQPVRLADLIGEWLKGSGLSPKEVALKTNLDVRTVQNAFAGHCGLETYGALIDAFDFDIATPITERRVGRDQLTAWEQRLARQRTEIEAGERRLERLRAAHKAGSAVVAGGLRLVGEPDRSFAPPARGALGNVGTSPVDGDER